MPGLMGPRGPDGLPGFIGIPGDPGDGGLNSPGTKGDRGVDGRPGDQVRKIISSIYFKRNDLSFVRVFPGQDPTSTVVRVRPETRVASVCPG